ncbi:MAG: sulfatase-like hydrolase/transferase [Candidatus Altiarchaeales archaeon]|nr:sulfatase-like hydrolase/transferase [Candidatus Altiarchaeales archaeon]MBD3416462.1 sulfatase-like hydrolase/transferase [Candidatus Altiarchaeales archaeon]
MRYVVFVLVFLVVGGLYLLAEYPSISGYGDAPMCEGCNLVLVTMDTTRADHLGLYGYDRDTSPFLDYLGNRSIVYERFYAPIPETNPSHATMFTSKLPYIHRLQFNGQKLRDSETTLAEILRGEGYDTVAFTSAKHLNPRTGLGQGFREFDYPKQKERKATITTDIALDWLREKEQGRFFMWVHYFDPHYGYEPPTPFSFYEEGMDENTGKIARYDGEIRYVDSEVRRLFEYLEDENLLQNTVFVVTADHGEGLGEHGYFWDHGDLLYEDQLWVPLLIYVDGTRFNSGRVGQNTQLMPTLLEILDIRDEHSVAPSLFSEEGRGMLFFESDRCEKQKVSGCFPGKSIKGKSVAALKDDVKFIATPVRDGMREELFDLRKDPGEGINRISNPGYEDIREELRTKALSVMKEVHNSDRDYIEVDNETLEVLKSLGYVN